MALRVSFAAVVVPCLFMACGDATNSPAGVAGSSPAGVVSSSAGSGGGGSTSSSGAAGASVAGTSPAVAGGGSISSSGAAGASAAGAAGSVGGGGKNFGVGGSVGGAGALGGTSGATSVGGGGGGGAPTGGSSAAGSGGIRSGVPEGWIVVDDVDYSVIPGPNFETVRLVFEGAFCSGSNCHFGGRNHFLVNKPPDELYSYMMKFTTLDCGKLIDTAHPAESALVKFLRGPCGMTERMPSYTCIEDTDEYCVPEYYIKEMEQWIADGAPRR